MKSKEVELIALCNIRSLSTDELILEGQPFKVSPEKAKELIDSNLAAENKENGSTKEV